MTGVAILKPVEDKTLRAQVAQQILSMVTGGHFLPGQRLTEISLSTQLQVSRAPLREAIRELVDGGILISEPYKGLRVRPVSVQDLEELYSMRTALEQFAFRLAWNKRSEAALQDLGDRYDRLIEVQTSGDQAKTVDCELAFHSWVYELSGHALLQSQWQRLLPLVQIYMSLHFKTHGSHGQFKHMTTEYLELARGTSLDAIQDHIVEHMQQGLASVKSTDLIGGSGGG